MMVSRRRRVIVAAVVVATLGAGGAAVAFASGDDDSSDKPITGSALDRAKAVALQHTGGGRVSGTEVGDEEGYYEVEVTRGDGSQVDVHLTRDFKLIDDKADGDGSHDDGPDND
jgi:uncharacterized membrane protein YkoI